MISHGVRAGLRRAAEPAGAGGAGGEDSAMIVGIMSRLSASVVVATFDRSEFLRRCLGSLLRQTADPAGYEIIVVDNNSTDDTGDLVERTARRHPAVHYVFEARPGLSHARNAGLSAAHGDIVAYIDDDAVASPGWLKTLLGSFERVRPSPHVVGGPAFPVFIDRRPEWFRDTYETAWWGDTPRFLERNEFFFGLNVAFARQLLVEAGGFDASLGMKGAELAFGEDDEVFERLWRHTGGRLLAYYAPEASVAHLIPATRAAPVYRLKRGFVSGQTRYSIDRVRGAGPVQPAGGAARRWWWARGKLFRVVGRLAASESGGPQRARLRWGNVAIEVGVPLAERLGYVAAMMGLRPLKVRRSH